MAKSIKVSGQLWLVGNSVAVSGAVAAVSPPGQAFLPVLSAGNGQVSVAQPTTLPAMNGGALLEWNLRHSADEAAWTEILHVLAFPYAIGGLTNGQLRYVQIAAVNDAGRGPWSVSASATPSAAAAVPGVMQPPVLTAGDGSIIANLAENTPNGGSVITSEDLRHSATDGSSWTTVTGVTDPATISSLTNGVRRYVQTRSVNAVGQGPWSASASAIPLALPPVAGWDPDVTVTNANLPAQLAAWSGSNWNSTVPAGKTINDERIIAVQSGSYGNWVMANYVFPKRVHVISVDKDGLGAKWNKLEARNCQNLGFAFIRVERIDMHGANRIGAFHMESCTGASVSYCWVHGPEDYQVIDQTKQYGLALKSCPGATVRDTMITDWPVGLSVENCPNAIIENNLWNNMKGDDGKCTGSDGITFRRNWSSLTKRLFDSGDHTDYFQEQTATNTPAPGKPVDGYHWIGHMLYQKTDKRRSFQGLFIAGVGKRTNFTCTDSVLCCNNSDWKFKTGAAFVEGDASNGVTYTTGLYPAPNSAGEQDFQGTLEEGGGTKANCIEARNTGYSMPATNIKIDIGANHSVADYTTQHAYYTGPIQQAASSRSPIHELMPVVGSQAHWGHASPKGAHNRLREIFVDGLHPGNSDNKPMAAHWHSQWNWDGFVTS